MPRDFRNLCLDRADCVKFSIKFKVISSQALLSLSSGSRVQE